MKIRNFFKALIIIATVVFPGLGGGLVAMRPAATDVFTQHKKEFLRFTGKARCRCDISGENGFINDLRSRAMQASTVDELNEVIGLFNDLRLSLPCSYDLRFSQIWEMPACHDEDGSSSSSRSSAVSEFVSEKALEPMPKKDTSTQELSEILQTLSVDLFHAAILAFRYRRADDTPKKKGKFMRELSFVFALQAVLVVGGSAEQKEVVDALLAGLKRDVENQHSAKEYLHRAQEKMKGRTLRDLLVHVSSAMKKTEQKFCGKIASLQRKFPALHAEAQEKAGRELSLFASWVRACCAIDRVMLCVIGVIDRDMAAVLNQCNNGVVCSRPQSPVSVVTPVAQLTHGDGTLGASCVFVPDAAASARIDGASTTKAGVVLPARKEKIGMKVLQAIEAEFNAKQPVFEYMKRVYMAIKLKRFYLRKSKNDAAGTLQCVILALPFAMKRLLEDYFDLADECGLVTQWIEQDYTAAQAAQGECLIAQKTPIEFLGSIERAVTFVIQDLWDRSERHQQLKAAESEYLSAGTFILRIVGDLKKVIEGQN